MIKQIRELISPGLKSNMIKFKGLLSCPICKSKKSLISRPMREGWIIYCNSCGDGRAEVYADSKKDAETKWNKQGSALVAGYASRRKG